MSSSGDRGGAETMLFRVVAAARRENWYVRCLVPEGVLAADLRDTGAEVRLVPPLRLAEGSKLRAGGALALATACVAARARRASHDADVVLANGLLVVAALRITPRSAPRVWWAHDVLVREDRVRVARWCAPALDLVVGVSQAVLEPLQGMGPPMVVVRNGVDLPDMRVHPPDVTTPPVVGCIAALTPWKGQHLLLEAVARLGRPDLRVELLGAARPKDAVYEARLRNRAARDDLEGRVRFLGHVAEPLEVMRRWHVGVSVSTDPEASGLGVLEGMSVGVPQLVASHGGPAEVLDGAGLMFAPGDVAGLAQGLERMLDDKRLWDRCSMSGPKVVAGQLHRPAQERALLDVLDAAAAGRRS